jgi:hypothetical protein
MRPETAKALVAQHRDELMHDTARRRSSARRLFPRYNVSWTRAILAGRGSSLVIIITAHRSA